MDRCVRASPPDAQYVTHPCTLKLDEEKTTFAHFAEAGKNRSKAVHLLEKSVINMI